MGTKKPTIWRLIAQSDLVAKGRMVSNGRKLKAKLNEYLTFQVELIEKILDRSRDCPLTINLKYFVKLDEKLNLSKIFEMDLLLFLIDLREDKYNQAFFLTGHPPQFITSTPKLVEEVKKEVLIQTEAITRFGTDAEAFNKYSHRTEVGRLVEEMLDPSKATQAYARLEELGAKAVPAMITHMGDRRELAVKHLQLENKSKDAWEAYRHYGPQVVVDALAAILNQITGESFGNIHNGGTEAERTKEHHGWLVWLSKQDLS